QVPHERRRPLVETDVVRDVAARTNDDVDRLVELPVAAEHVGDTVEVGAPPGAHDDALAPGERFGSIELDRRLAQALEEGVDGRERRGVAFGADDPLVAFGPDQLELRSTPDRRGHLERFGNITAAGAAALEADLEEDLDRTLRATQYLRHRLDCGGRVDETVEIELGLARQLPSEPAKRDRLDELVREQDPLHAEGAVDPSVARRRRGDRPSAGLQLALEEL